MNKWLLLVCLSYMYVANAQQAKFDPSSITLTTGSDMSFVGTGDLNGDKLTDLVGITDHYFDPANDYNIFIWLQHAGGLSTTPLKFPYSPRVVTSLTVGSVSTSAAQVLVGTEEGLLYIYSLSGSNLILTDTLRTGNKIPQDGITLNDFDGDGYTDIGIANSGGDYITVIYQTAEMAKWDIRNYMIPTNSVSYVSSGKYGPLQKPALIYSTIFGGGPSLPPPIIALTFDAARMLDGRYDMHLTVTSFSSVYCTAVVKKGGGTANELWAVYGGNKPTSQVAVWRGLQDYPDSTFVVTDIPQVIKSYNLDCDDGDEPVIVHGGWNQITVFTNTEDAYKIKGPQNPEPDAVAIGDINNDKRPDICIANGIYPGNVLISYNITSPCWTSSVPPSVPVSSIHTFPNPATDVVHARTYGVPAAGALWQLLSTDGRNIETLEAKQQETVFNVSQLSPGIYYIRYTDAAYNQTTKLVKQ